MKNTVTLLRRIAFIEGVSFLVLLGIAMPLKYMAGMPLAVSIVGMAHGILFVLFGFALMRVMMTTSWPMSRAALVFISSLLPFGPMLLDARMRQWERE